MILDMLHSVLCFVGIHRKKAFYDPEYSRRREAYYCRDCDAEFDYEKRRIKEAK